MPAVFATSRIDRPVATRRRPNGRETRTQGCCHCGCHAHGSRGSRRSTRRPLAHHRRRSSRGFPQHRTPESSPEDDCRRVDPRRRPSRALLHWPLVGIVAWTYDRSVVDSVVTKIAGNGLKVSDILAMTQGLTPINEVDHRATLAFSRVNEIIAILLDLAVDRRISIIYISNGYVDRSPSLTGAGGRAPCQSLRSIRGSCPAQLSKGPAWTPPVGTPIGRLRGAAFARGPNRVAASRSPRARTWLQHWHGSATSYAGDPAAGKPATLLPVYRFA